MIESKFYVWKVRKYKHSIGCAIKRLETYGERLEKLTIFFVNFELSLKRVRERTRKRVIERNDCVNEMIETSKTKEKEIIEKKNELKRKSVLHKFWIYRCSLCCNLKVITARYTRVHLKQANISNRPTTHTKLNKVTS